MYHRYKSKKQGFSPLKTIIIISLLTVFSYFGYQYRGVLMFWKYSYNKLYLEYRNAKGIENPDKRRSELEKVLRKTDLFLLETPLSTEAHWLSGLLHIDLANASLNASFLELLINDRFSVIPVQAFDHFIAAIKKIRKGSALCDNGELALDYRMALARAMFYTDFMKPVKIYKELLKDIDDYSKLNTEDRKLFITLAVESKDLDEDNIKRIQDIALNNETADLLFAAKMMQESRHYTDAIDIYKRVLKQERDSKIIKLVYNNLGCIYYDQNLFRESAASIRAALNIDPDDPVLLVAAGKAYRGMNKAQLARDYWRKALQQDPGNREAAELMSR